MREMNVKLKIIYDKSKPDGVPRKLLDVSLAKKYGWVSKTSLEKGFLNTLEDFKADIEHEKKYYSDNRWSRFCWFKSD